MNDEYFKEACKAIKPYFDVFSEKFLTDLKDDVFLKDADGFHQAKAEFNLINKMRTLINNSTLTEGDS